MPEGDTLHKLARYLSPRLSGQTLQGFEAPQAQRALIIKDDTVLDVHARGKHLVVRFQSGRSLRVHLGMHGSFHHYHHNAHWKRSPRTAQVILATDNGVYVCFRPTKVEFTRAKPPTALRLLGPDLADGAPTTLQLKERVQAALERSPRVDDLLLDQQVACGIGNVYKSEILFIHQMSPHRLVERLTPREWTDLYATGAHLLRDNLRGGPRVTTRQSLPELNAQGSNLWVYGRRALPCYRCGSQIQKVITGRQARITYWCPGCQS